jgi:hypothetical protein
MIYRIGSALLALVLFAPVAALARDNTTRSLDIPSAVVVGNQHLKPGHYKVEWQAPGPQVEVSFVRNGKTVASVPGTLKTNDMQVTQSDIVTRETASHRNVLTEIDFGHQKEAILFARRQS